MKEDTEKGYGERIKETITQKTPTKTIPISFPRKSFRDFSRWAYEHANDCYWLAIEKLMDAYETKVHLQHELRLLADRDDILLTYINELNEKLDAATAQPTKTERKHFGKKGE